MEAYVEDYYKLHYQVTRQKVYQFMAWQVEKIVLQLKEHFLLNLMLSKRASQLTDKEREVIGQRLQMRTTV